jgi:hypothetical protein
MHTGLPCLFTNLYACLVPMLTTFFLTMAHSQDDEIARAVAEATKMTAK